MPTPLPGDASQRPNLEYHRKRAKALLKEVESGSASALDRFAALEITEPKLADAQLVIARENGFSSWSQLKRHIEGPPASNRLRPYVREVAWYEERAEGMLRAYKGQMESVAQLIASYLPGATPETFKTEDALFIQARQHGFESWPKFTAHIESLEEDTLLLAFEALQKDDIAALRLLLQKDPTLANSRGSNGNTLLNLAASFRRLDACQLLIETGANVNLGNNYGWTPVHQAAMSGNLSLLEKLLSAGGDLTLIARGEGGTPLVQALFWGKDEMADAIAERNITPRNLRVAAGLGRLDLLDACFDSEGKLTAEAKASREFYRPHGEFPEWAPSDNTQEILDESFTYACRNGRTKVLQFLLDRGANIEGNPYQGTGLIWAACMNQLDTVRWLVEHGADINHQTTFGGRQHGIGITPLHLAAQNGELEKVRFLVELGADTDLPDHLYDSTPTGWAEFFDHRETAAYLLSLPNPGVLNLSSRGLNAQLEKLLKANPT
ncbi:ankyrin repeat domain-containing protein, partial [bacterium]